MESIAESIEKAEHEAILAVEQLIRSVYFLDMDNYMKRVFRLLPTSWDALPIESRPMSP